MAHSAYHGDDSFKQTAVRLMTGLRDLAWISPGTVNEKGVGAAVTMVMNRHSGDDAIKGFCETLGFPEWLVFLYNHIYEGLAEDVANNWAVEFLKAIPVGCDLDDLKGPLYRALLADDQIGVRHACDSNDRVRAIIDDLLECLAGYPDPEEPYLRLRREIDLAYRPFDVGEDKELRPACALFCVDWIMIDARIYDDQTRHDTYAAIDVAATNAVAFAVSARVGCLSSRAAWRHMRRHGQDTLTGAVFTLLGGNGYALRSDREAQYRRIADYLVNEVHKILRPPMAATASTTRRPPRRWYRSGLRTVPKAGEDPVGLEKLIFPDPPEQVNDLLIPDVQIRKWRHWTMKITGLSACYLGWVMVMFGWCALVTVYGTMFSGNHLGGHAARHVDWLPYQIGAFVLLPLSGTQIVYWGRRMSRGDGWYKVLRYPDRLVLYLRMFEDDRTRLHGLLRWFVPRLSIEEEVVEALQGLDDVVMMGDPRDRPMNRIGSHIYLRRGEDWRRMVCWLMQRAQVTVLMFGYSNGIRTEMQWCRQLLPPEKVVLHVPYHRWGDWVRYDHYGWHEEPKKFEKVLQEILSSNMRTAHHASTEDGPSFLWFRPGWRVQSLRPYDTDHMRERWRRSKGRLYREALRPLCRKLGALSGRPRGGRVLLAGSVWMTSVVASLLLAQWLGLQLLWVAASSFPATGILFSEVSMLRNIDSHGTHQVKSRPGRRG